MSDWKDKHRPHDYPYTDWPQSEYLELAEVEIAKLQEERDKWKAAYFGAVQLELLQLEANKEVHKCSYDDGICRKCHKQEVR